MQNALQNFVVEYSYNEKMLSTQTLGKWNLQAYWTLDQWVRIYVHTACQRVMGTKPNTEQKH